MSTCKKCLAYVCYRPPDNDSQQWLTLLTAFLETTANYEKVLITIVTSIFLTSLSSNTSYMHPSTGSAEFKELSLGFFLHQVNFYPTRQNHILDLVLTSAFKNIGNLSCIPPSNVGISIGHQLLLLFFHLLLFVKSTGCNRTTVSDFQHACLNTVRRSLSHFDLALNNSTNSDDDWTKWKDLFLAAAAKHIPQKKLKRRTTWFEIIFPAATKESLFWARPR